MRFVSLFLLCLLPLFAKDSFLNISLVGMSFDYREYDDDNLLLDTERSGFNDVMGVDIEYTKELSNEKFKSTALVVDFMYLSGLSEYVGSLLSSDEGYGSIYSVTANDVLDMSVKYDVSTYVDEEWRFVYEMGLGYRGWNRALSVAQVELYQWIYLRLGGGVEYQSEKLTLTPKLVLEYGIAPEMILLQTYDNPETTLTLGGANIYALEIPLEYRLSERYAFTCKYTFHYQDIKESNEVDYIVDGELTQVYEPKSTAYNQYFEVGLKYRF